MCTTTITMPNEIWTVWTDLGQTDGHMIGFKTQEEFDQYEHDYNVKTYGENYEEVFEQYEAEAEEYACELGWAEINPMDDNNSNITYDMDEFLAAIEAKSTLESNEPRWLSEEEIRQAGIAFNGVDLESPEERAKTQLMFEEMQAEEDFINNNKVSTILDDGTVLETEFSQLKNIC